MRLQGYQQRIKFAGSAESRPEPLRPGTGQVVLRSKPMIRNLVIAVLWALTASADAALAAPDPTTLGGLISTAAPVKANERDLALVAKAEILLDRAHVSPGEIDGLDGDNFRNAVRAFQQLNRLPVSGNLDVATWGALKRDGEPVLRAYTITLADAAGPFSRLLARSPQISR